MGEDSKLKNIFILKYFDTSSSLNIHHTYLYLYLCLSVCLSGVWNLFETIFFHTIHGLQFSLCFYLIVAHKIY